MKKILNTAILLCLILLLSSCASKGDTIGILQFAEHPSLDNCREGFIEGLRLEGYSEPDITFVYKNSQAKIEDGNQISQNFVSQKVKLICAIATPAAQAAFNAAEKSKIPVIYTAVSDPVTAGLANDDGTSGKNVTGSQDLLPLDKQLEMIRAFLPDAKKIGILYTTSEVNSETHIGLLRDISSDYGFEIVAVGVSSQAELPQALDNLLTQVDCINNLTDNTVVQSLSLVLDKANKAGVPVFGSEEEQVKNGCVASVSIDYFSLGVQTGKLAARVLNGEDITTIPFEVISDSQPVVNKNAMEALGLKLPDSFEGNVAYIGD